MTGRRQARAAAAFALAPVWRRLRPRIETIARTIAHEVAEEAARNAAREAGAAEAAHRVQELQELRGHVDGVVGDLHAHQDDIDNKLRLMAAQLAATDARVAALERPPVDLVADDAERAEARRLIDEIRTEHRRAGRRLAAVAFYEERIARLERDGHR